MSAAPSFVQLVHAQHRGEHSADDFRRAVIRDYRALARELMLNRIAAFSGDRAFADLADELAEILGCDRRYASMQLYEVSSAVYKAAEAAAYE